jgi:hypothetical protein
VAVGNGGWAGTISYPAMALALANLPFEPEGGIQTSILMSPRA